MKWIACLMAMLVCLFQYKLWFDDAGVMNVMHLSQQIKTQIDANDAIAKQNKWLETEIIDLKNGTRAIEARARIELGMVKQGETYYHFE